MYPAIELKNISLSFNNKPVLRDVNLTVEVGDSLTIMGPGGCGKSVLMKVMSLIIAPDSGEIYFYGKNVSRLSSGELQNFRKRTGMLFQNYALFDSMTVRENVGFYMDYHTKVPHQEISKMVTDNLKLVLLKGIESLRPVELSGGMKKRVGIARAINHKPDIVFLDEPTAGLDPITTDSISKVINNLHQSLGKTFISVSNDMIFIKRVGSRLAMLYEGVIHKVDLREKMLESSDPVVHQFVRGKRQGPINQHERISPVRENDD
ncbi:MAG: ATP-binding cassette domain-containing protein, partial [Spirochaetota bacterium]|nr:ATP-binding cassette domain-containing protein [Spirochaetota bacterium]